MGFGAKTSKKGVSVWFLFGFLFGVKVLHYIGFC